MQIPYSISKSALQSHQHKMNYIAHNISNVNTVGFKKQDVQFNELLHNAVNDQDVRLADGTNEVSNGMGVKIGATKNDFSQGSLNQSDDPLHLSINGNGFFGVRNSDGELMLTRDGAFHVSENGSIVNDRGDTLELSNTIPGQQWQTGELSVGETGQIMILTDQGTQVAGNISLFMPANSNGLSLAGNNMYRINEEAELLSNLANPELFGSIGSGYLENSTVDLAQSMTDMMMSQRAYSLNSKVMQSTDEIFSLINQFT